MTSPSAPLDPDALRRAFADLSARVAYLERVSGLFVDDKELDNPRRSLKIHFDPRNWRGPSHKGRLAKDCAPDFLEAYAEAMQYMAEHPKAGDDPKKAGYNRLDAARARSWARRLRRAAASGPPADGSHPSRGAATGPAAPDDDDLFPPDDGADDEDDEAIFPED